MLRDGDDRGAAVRGVQPSRVCLLRGVWPLLCGVVPHVRNVPRPYGGDLLPVLTCVRSLDW